MSKGLSERLCDELDTLFNNAIVATFDTDCGIKGYDLLAAWHDDPVLQDIPFHHEHLPAKALTFSQYCLKHIEKKDFDARLVFCYDVVHCIHCICEIADKDHQVSYYLDIHCNGVAGARNLIGYYFIAASPWNPMNDVKEEWVTINQEAC